MGPNAADGQERRRQPRFSIRLPVLFSTEQMTGEAVLTDLCDEGCFLKGVGPLPTGTLLTLRLRLPAPYFLVTIEQAVVRWVGDGVGVQFLALSQQDQRELERFLTHQFDPKRGGG